MKHLAAEQWSTLDSYSSRTYNYIQFCLATAEMVDKMECWSIGAMGLG